LDHAQFIEKHLLRISYNINLKGSSNTENNRAVGGLCESEACKYLCSNGYKIIERNFRVGKLGEIDIIAFEREVLCFIEVKARKTSYFGSPAEAVNNRKQRRIAMIASIYSADRRLDSNPIRFDIVEIIFINRQSGFEIKETNLIRDAF
jgi:putative endonuclease